MLTDRHRHAALMQVITSSLEDTIKTKQHKGEMEGYPPAISFVKSVLSDRCAERNASQMSVGPKIDWTGNVYFMLEGLMAAIKGGKGKAKGKAKKARGGSPLGTPNGRPKGEAKETKEAKEARKAAKEQLANPRPLQPLQRLGTEKGRMPQTRPENGGERQGPRRKRQPS